jgi:hypothetical protein
MELVGSVHEQVKENEQATTGDEGEREYKYLSPIFKGYRLSAEVAHSTVELPLLDMKLPCLDAELSQKPGRMRVRLFRL